MKASITSIFILLLIVSGGVQAQIDPHFSQYYAYPLWLNPALTGVVDGDVRLTGNYRNQWTGLGGAYKTTALSGDFRQSEKIAFGANVINQQAGTVGFNYLAAYGSFSYQVPVSADGYRKLNMGLQVGMINRRFDVSRLQLDEQYNPSIGFDPNMQSTEQFAGTGNTAFDAGAGVFYYDGTPSSKANLFGGLSLVHLAGAKDPFRGNNLDSKIPVRLNVHGGLRVAAGFVDITPHFVYIRQGNDEIKAAGANVEFNLQSDYSLMIGGMLRVNDAAVGNVALYTKNLIIGISYDYTTSNIGNLSNPSGTYELSLSYVFKRRLTAREEKCPRL
jgi:type IX secretion system PorP/SprF family membrane protein